MALFSTEINVVGLTVSEGNVGQKHTLRNMKNLLKTWNREDIPIYVGSENPITAWSFNEDLADGFHGDRGFTKKMQEYFVQNHRNLVKETGTCILDLYNALMKLDHKIIYMITGPCTTFALLIKVFPDVMEKIERVIIMGSSFSYGNITKHAEFNTFVDPESYLIVAMCPLEVIVYGLESLDFISHDKEFTRKVNEHPSPWGWMLAECYEQVHKATIELENDPDYPPVCYDCG